MKISHPPPLPAGRPFCCLKREDRMMTSNPTDAGPMSPGTYMQKRREAAGLSREALAACLAAAGPGADAAAYLDRLGKLEAHDLDSFTAATHLDLLDRLHGWVRYDQAVYFSLIAAADNPSRYVPPVCRSCACSWEDPCLETQDGEVTPCGWANAGTTEAPICSRCDRELRSNGGQPPAEVRHAA